MNLKFLFKNSYRDLRSGSLNLILISLTIAIGSISCISFLSDRVKQSLNRDIQASLGGDRRITSTEKIPNDWIVKAEDSKISWAKGVRFPTMAMNGNKTKLISLKAVSENYPLKGNLEIDTPNGLKINPKI